MSRDRDRDRSRKMKTWQWHPLCWLLVFAIQRMGFQSFGREDTFGFSVGKDAVSYVGQRKMGSHSMQAAKAYHYLLKAVKNHIGDGGNKRHFKDFIMQDFHKVSDPSAVPRKINLAHDYTFLLNSIHHHKDLLFSYNIAIDRSDEVQRTLKKSAGSVGLQLPEVYQS